MALRTRSVWVAPSDRSLTGLNDSLRSWNVRAYQLRDFDVATGENGWDQVFVSYDDDAKLELVYASVPSGAWFHASYPPSTIRLLFNYPVSKDSILNGTFKVVQNTGTTSVLASNVAVDGAEVALTLSLTGTGSVQVFASGLKSVDGLETGEPVQISFDIGPTTHRAFAAPGPVSRVREERRGLLRATSLYVPHGAKAETLVTQFMKSIEMEPEALVRTVYRRSGSGGRVYVLWYDLLAPRMISVSPLPGSVVSQEAPPDRFVVAFDRPVAVPVVGSDFALEGPGNPSVTVTQLDSEGRLYKFAASMAQAGVYTLRLHSVRTRLGDRTVLPVRHITSLIVMPLAQTGGTTPINPFCERYTTDGVSVVYTLANTPYDPCSLLVFLNGVEQTECYTYSPTPSPRITFTTIPQANWNLVIKGWAT